MKCTLASPAHAGRPRKSGKAKLHNNGWFMVIHPATGLILTVREMMNPENNSIALEALNQTMSVSGNIGWVRQGLQFVSRGYQRDVFQSHQNLVCCFQQFPDLRQNLQHNVSLGPSVLCAGICSEAQRSHPNSFSYILQ